MSYYRLLFSTVSDKKSMISLIHIVYCFSLATFKIFSLSCSSGQSLSHVQLFVTPWTAALQTFLSITNPQSLLKLMSIESVMPSNHLILGPLLSPAFNLAQHQGLFQ